MELLFCLMFLLDILLVCLLFSGGFRSICPCVYYLHLRQRHKDTGVVYIVAECEFGYITLVDLRIDKLKWL